MSTKGAVKKATEPKRQTSRTRSSSQSINDFNERIEKRKEPQILDLKASGDRKSKVGTSSSSKNLLPDKNPVKLKQLKQNGWSTSSIDDSQSSSGSSKKQATPRTKIESSKRSQNTLSTAKKEVSLRNKSESIGKSQHTPSTVKKSALNKTKSETAVKINNTEISKTNVQRVPREKHQSVYNEKRGVSSLYVPKDAAGKLKSTVKSLENSRKGKETASVSRSYDKTVSKHLPKERSRSRTLDPNEVKVLQAHGKSKYLRHSKDEAGAKLESDYDEDVNYEDDFEDYESELDDYSGSSQIAEESDNSISSLDLEPIVLRTEEKKRTIDSAVIRRPHPVNIGDQILDSGHFELSDSRKRATMIDTLLGSRQTSPPIDEKKLNGEDKQSEIKSLPSSTDEGFEDGRSGDFIKSPPVSKITFMNKAKSKQNNIDKKPKKFTRGQILMKMIKLDTIDWSLYESKPISYDEFIRIHGRLNTQQTSTQTNEDNLDVEIQTESYEVENKWTQFPVICRNNLKTNEDIRLFKMEHMGVGGDKLNSAPSINPSYDALNLNEFLSRASKVMLALLEEKELGGNVLQSETHEFPFSDGIIKLSVKSLSFLCGRQVTLLQYSEISNKILLSIHAPTNERIEYSSKADYIMNCCIGCVWNINEPSKPIKLFYSQNPITTCCFHCTNNSIVFAGLKDGSICLWDLREEETWHQKVIDKINEMDWIIRSPTYTTAGNWESDAHISPIVALRILSKVEQDETQSFNDKFVSIQICSLDEEGRLIIWSVLRNLSHNSDDLGLTQWGKVKLVKSQEVPLFKRRNELKTLKKEFVDIGVDNVDRNNLYLATNDTTIMHVNCIGGRNNIIYYKINEMDSCGNTTCIEPCPFKQSYFLAGCKDGSIRLHCSDKEIPLLKLKDEENSIAIRSIQWSKSKPLTIYALDNQSRIVIWDLSNSDLYPIYTVPTNDLGLVNSIKLSPCNSRRDMLNQYLALGTGSGNVEVHKLKKKFHYSQENDFLKEMDTFLRYVSIL